MDSSLLGLRDCSATCPDVQGACSDHRRDDVAEPADDRPADGPRGGPDQRAVLEIELLNRPDVGSCCASMQRVHDSGDPVGRPIGTDSGRASYTSSPDRTHMSRDPPPPSSV